jgi:hypothetical protein
MLFIIFLFVSYSVGQERVFIKNVPDYCQPPDSIIKSTRDRSNFCAPMAFANIVAYWDSVQNHAFARNVMGGLSGKGVAEYIGWFMDTNDQGNPGRDNGTGRPSAKGTYGHDQWTGAEEYIHFDSVNTSGYPDSIPGEKVGYGWDIQQIPVDDFLILKDELNTYSPVKADFYYWNIFPTGLYLTDPLMYDDTVHIYEWGNRVNQSGSVDEGDPLEIWNLIEEDPGGNIGHAVTVVGYLENFRADTSYVIVHDNWPNTPRNIAIPWLQGYVSSWMFAHLPKLPDLKISNIFTLIDTTKGHTDSLWVDMAVTTDLKIHNLGQGGAGAYLIEISVDDPLSNQIASETKHLTDILDAHGWGRDSILVRFDSLFIPSENGLYTINSKIDWDQNRNGVNDDPDDDDPSNDALSVSFQVYVKSTHLADGEGVIRKFHLFQNHPNPFNPRTMITYHLSMKNEVELSIYNTYGQRVTTLVAGEQAAGNHHAVWDASGFASGIYYYMLKAGKFEQTRKMVLLK